METDNKDSLQKLIMKFTIETEKKEDSLQKLKMKIHYRN